MDANRIITLFKNNNIILRAEKIKSGYTLFLDIHYKGKRIREYLKIRISSVNQKKHTQTDKQILKIAKKLQAKRLIEISEGTYQDIQVFNSNTSLLKYYNELVNDRIINNDKSLYKWRSSHNHFKKYVKNRQISFKDVNRRLLEGYRSYLLNALSQNTARTYFAILSEVFEKARIDNIIQVNPMQDVRSIKLAGTSKTFLTEKEFKKILNTKIETDFEMTKKAFIFSCLTGIRYDDVRQIKGDQIREEKKGHYLYFISSKSKKSDRIKLHPLAVTQLTNIGIDEHVFPGLVTKKYINRHLQKIATAAGINKHITFHVAKHTFATIALNAGVDIYTLKELLHHSDIRTTEIYARLLSKVKDEAIDKLFRNS